MEQLIAQIRSQQRLNSCTDHSNEDSGDVDGIGFWYSVSTRGMINFTQHSIFGNKSNKNDINDNNHQNNHGNDNNNNNNINNHNKHNMVNVNIAENNNMNTYQNNVRSPFLDDLGILNVECENSNSNTHYILNDNDQSYSDVNDNNSYANCHTVELTDL